MQIWSASAGTASQDWLRIDRRDIHRHRVVYSVGVPAFQTQLADIPRSWQSVYSLNSKEQKLTSSNRPLSASHLQDRPIRYRRTERPHRHVPHVNTNANALESQSRD